MNKVYKLEPAERETSIVFSDARDDVIITTSQESIKKKIEGWGYVGEVLDKYGTVRYLLPYDEFRITKKFKRNVSEAESKRRSELFRNIRSTDS